MLVSSAGTSGKTGAPPWPSGQLVAADGVGGHGQRAHGVTVHQDVRRVAGDRRQPRQVPQREEVIRGGGSQGEVGVVGELREVDRRAGHELGGGVIEAPRPVETAVGPIPVDEPQVVHHVAAADDRPTVIGSRGPTRVAKRPMRADKTSRERKLSRGRIGWARRVFAARKAAIAPKPMTALRATTPSVHPRFGPSVRAKITSVRPATTSTVPTTSNPGAASSSCVLGHDGG